MTHANFHSGTQEPKLSTSTTQLAGGNKAFTRIRLSRNPLEGYSIFLMTASRLRAGALKQMGVHSAKPPK